MLTSRSDRNTISDSWQIDTLLAIQKIQLGAVMRTQRQQAELLKRKQQGIGWHGKQNGLVFSPAQSPAERDMNAHRRGSTVVHVNAAYTSQMDSRNGTLSGKRRGDLFYCEEGVVLQADVNAARNVLARYQELLLPVKITLPPFPRYFQTILIEIVLSALYAPLKPVYGYKNCKKLKIN